MNFSAYKEKRKTVLAVGLVFLIAILLNGRVLYEYFATDMIPGWDATTHYSFALYYADRIFPATYGWAEGWYAGMPFPQFYPPLFYYVFAVFEHLNLLDPVVLFKLMAVLSHFAAILVLGLVYRRHVDREGENFIWVMLFCVLLSSLGLRIADMGFGLSGLVNIGLVPHSFSFLLVMLWLFWVPNLKSGPYHAAMTALLLALVILTSVHAAFACLLMYALYFLADAAASPGPGPKARVLGRYLAPGAVAVLLAAFWIVPAAALSEYSAAKPIGYPENIYEFGLRHLFFMVVPLAAIWLMRRKRIEYNRTISVMTWYCGLSFLLFFIPASRFSALPFHVDRLLAGSLLFVPALLVFLITRLDTRPARVAGFGLSLGILLFLNLLSGFKTQPVYFLKTFDDYSQVLGLTDELRGRHVLVESVPDGGTYDSVLNSRLGLRDNRTTFAILRESSISSLFFTPIRNSFSYIKEFWAIRSLLSTDAAFLDRPVEQRIADARLIGVTDLLIRSVLVQEKLAEPKEKLFSSVERYGKWTRYEIAYERDESPDLELLAYKPVLLLSDFDVKRYNGRQADFVSLAEQWLRQGIAEPRIVHADMQDLQEIRFEDYSLVLLDETYARRGAEVVSRIRSASGIGIFVPSSSGIAGEGIFAYTGFEEESQAAWGQALADELKKQLIPTMPIPLEQMGFSEGDDWFSVANGSAQDAYAVIKRSYFPGWHSAEDEDARLVNPSLRFVRIPAGQSRAYAFAYPGSFYAGHAVSLGALMLLAAYAIGSYLSARKKPIHIAREADCA